MKGSEERPTFVFLLKMLAEVLWSLRLVLGKGNPADAETIKKTKQAKDSLKIA